MSDRNTISPSSAICVIPSLRFIKEVDFFWKVCLFACVLVVWLESLKMLDNTFSLKKVVRIVG
jgi:hypothetical protein